MDNITWYENMRQLREFRNYSQRELSQLIGVSERTLQRYESGESEPTVSVLVKLSQLYDISIDEIVGNHTTRTINLLDIKNSISAIEHQCNALRNTISHMENINNIIE